MNYTRRPYELMYNTDESREDGQSGGKLTHKWTNQERTVVAADETVTVLVLQLTIHVLFRLLHCNVHETVKPSKHA
jgi:hypothetical protein